MEASSERRLVENELIFRQTNEKVTSGLKDLAQLAAETNQMELAPDLDSPVLFYCECSNENCRERIKLAPNEYQSLHQNSSQFVVKPGHNIPEIERVMRSEGDYLVVEKFITPPDNADILHSTS